MGKTIVLLRLSLTLILIGVVNIAHSSDIKSLPVFDAHIHYSHDVWKAIPPKEAISRLRALGINRAMVSSTPDDGTQKLYETAPDFVVPVLRPYRKLGTLQSWMFDESVIPYIKSRLEKYRYAAIGELHLEGNEAHTPVIRAVVDLAKQYDIMLHVHSDARAIQFIFEQYPEARILWAHVGFEDHFIAREMLSRHKNLWADLTFRYDIMFRGVLMPEWRGLLTDHSDRFLLGLDTYEPPRWLEIKEVMGWQQELLSKLPGDVAKKIAHENGEQMLAHYDSKQ